MYIAHLGKRSQIIDSKVPNGILDMYPFPGGYALFKVVMRRKDLTLPETHSKRR